MHACCIPVPNETKAAFMQFLHHPSFEPGIAWAHWVYKHCNDTYGSECHC